MYVTIADTLIYDNKYIWKQTVTFFNLWNFVNDLRYNYFKPVEHFASPARHKHFLHLKLSSQTSNKCSLKTVMHCLMFANICEHWTTMW